MKRSQRRNYKAAAAALHFIRVLLFAFFFFFFFFRASSCARAHSPVTRVQCLRTAVEYDNSDRRRQLSFSNTFAIIDTLIHIERKKQGKIEMAETQI